MKAAGGWPATPEEADAEPDVWSGLVPLRSVLEEPLTAPWAADLPVPGVGAPAGRGAPQKTR